MPDQRTQFVGRETELQQIALRHEQGERLITLLGAGGTGKTRLAIHYGRLHIESMKGGVWIADLTNAKSTADVCSAVARALDLPLTTKNSVVQVGQAIHARGEMMLVLDNFEQVVASASETVANWLSMAPKAHFLVTSSQVLGIRGEQLLAVDPLPVPPNDLEDDVREDQVFAMSRYDAVSLFCLRAQQVDPAFELNLQNVVPVVNIVRYLDGIPLAIEFAASRVRMMQPNQLFQRIQHRMDVLRGPTKSGTERQATLRGAIDWSWRTLEPWEQAALCRCAIFRGGFSLDAAEALLDLSAWSDAPFGMDVVQALHDKSLLFRVRSQDDAEVRFDMYRSIRNYAEDKFRTDGVISGAIGRTMTGSQAYREGLDQHAEYFALRCARANDGAPGQIRSLAPDLDNLLKASRHASTHQLADLAAATILAAITIIGFQGPFASTISLSDTVLRVEDLTVDARMRILNARGTALRIIGNSIAAQAAFEQALDLAYAQQNHVFEATVRINLSVLCRQIGRMDGARSHAEAALELALAAGEHRLAARVLSNLGRYHQERGEVETAASYFQRATQFLQEVDEPRLQAITDLNVGEIALMQGRYAESDATLARVLAVLHEQGDRIHAGIAHILLAKLRLEQRDVSGATAHFNQALTVARSAGNRRFEGLALTGFARLHIYQSELADASEAIAIALPILEGSATLLPRARRGLSKRRWSRYGKTDIRRPRALHTARPSYEMLGISMNLAIYCAHVHELGFAKAAGLLLTEPSMKPS